MTANEWANQVTISDQKYDTIFAILSNIIKDIAIFENEINWAKSRVKVLEEALDAVLIEMPSANLSDYAKDLLRNVLGE